MTRAAPAPAPRGDLVVATPRGLYCPAGDFYIDPWRPVPRAVITHAHSDHARRGHGAYLAQAQGEGVLRARLGADIRLQAVAYGEAVTIHGVRVSLHPAGHVLGSAQVRLEHAGRVWVASGDYKLDPDPTCAPFEPLRCDVFITESTFGLPIYRWPSGDDLFADMSAWWRANADAGRASVVYAYAFGKAQRVLAGVDHSVGPLVCHGAVQVLNDAYRTAGNIGLDCLWNGVVPELCDANARLQRFFLEHDRTCVYAVDGTPVDETVLHPVGFIAATAEGSLAAMHSQEPDALDNAIRWVRLLWDTPIRTGMRRYYDNFLYAFAFLALAGEYRVW